MSRHCHCSGPIGLLYLVSALVALGIGLFLAATPLQALPGVTTITVNSTADVINPVDNLCTLREAIRAANTDTASGGGAGECPAGSGADRVVVPAGTYTLTIGGPLEENGVAGDLDITQDVTISGAGVLSTTILRGASSNDRLFDIHPTARATMSKVLLLGGIDNGFCGGGIRDRGSLTMTDVLFIANHSSVSGGGLCVGDSAHATLNTVSFGANTAYSGAAISNGGTLTLTNVALDFGTAETSGGVGGGLLNSNVATLTDVTIAVNTAGSSGGGIANISGYMTLSRVTISDNQATSADGGGIYNTGDITLTNVTLSNNKANATSGKGGALYDGVYTGATATLLNVTVYSNTASAGGGIYRDPAATLGPIYLKNTIIANSASGGNCGGGAITSQGYNLDSANACGLSNTGDLHDKNPLLGPLTDNGGATWTHALLVGSPAIDHGTNSGCPLTDQRRVGRPFGTACDIGAYEYNVARLFLPFILKSP